MKRVLISRSKSVTAILVLLILVMLVSQAFGASQGSYEEFTDVNPGAWYYNDVKQARAAGYITGVGHNLYSPNTTITYAEFLTIVSRICDSGVDQRTAGANWYDKYITSARNIGALSKDEAITALAGIPRQDMIKYTCRALGVEPYTGNEVVFNDVKPEDAAYINAAYQNYLTEGIGGHAFDKTLIFGYGKTSTRSELAAMANRIFEYRSNPVVYKEKRAAERAAAEQKAQEAQQSYITFRGYKIPKDFKYYDETYPYNDNFDFYGFVRWKSAPEGFDTMQSILSSKWDAAVVKQAIDYGKTKKDGVKLPYKDFDTGKGYYISVNSAPLNLNVVFEVVKIQE